MGKTERLHQHLMMCGIDSVGDKLAAEGSGTFPLIRVGAAYEYHVGKYAVEPTFFLDFAEGKFTDVIGVSVGMGF